MNGAVLVLIVALLASCSSDPERVSTAPSPSPSSVSSSPAAVDPSPEPEVFAPDPDAPIPTWPAELAAELVTVTEALRGSIDQWTKVERAPRVLVLQALYQQRIYGTLARDADLRSRVLDRLPQSLRGMARANSTAGAKLVSLVTPISKPSAFRTARPERAEVLRGWFEEAEARFGVDWELLAAVMYVESKFGRVRSASTAGAQGPMQFIPSTWAGYGLGGDIHDPHDSILGAANYLHASGAPDQERKALYAYNHAWEYVDAIQSYADQIRKDPRNYYAYYHWQVFVLTTEGPVRLTGPGR
jgi:soluble lytic murein transglycosylase-like protein